MSEQTSREPRWLTDEQSRDWQSVMALLMTLPPALDAQLRRDAGLNSFEYHILVRLADRPDGTLGMGELAAHTQGSPSRLSHAVSRLERHGWIERRSGEARCVNAHITADGLRKLVEAAPEHVHEVRRLVVDALTPEQLRALGEAARLVAGRADPAWIAALDKRAGRTGC
ncbi:MAG: MarR family transcriptional regulator [Micropruina sp.]|nr:MarR family transcriptional regulator [Micropruina sp.]